MLTLCSPGVGDTDSRIDSIRHSLQQETIKEQAWDNQNHCGLLPVDLLTADGSMATIKMIQALSAPSPLNLMLHRPALRTSDRSGRLAQSVRESTPPMTMTINCPLYGEGSCHLNSPSDNGLRPLSGCRFRLSNSPDPNFAVCSVAVH